MRELRFESDGRLLAYVNDTATSESLRQWCFGELQRRYRDKHGLNVVAKERASVVVRPCLPVGVRYG